MASNAAVCLTKKKKRKESFFNFKLKIDRKKGRILRVEEQTLSLLFSSEHKCKLASNANDHLSAKLCAVVLFFLFASRVSNGQKKRMMMQQRLQKLISRQRQKEKEGKKADWWHP